MTLQKRHIEEEEHKARDSSWRNATRPSSTDADAGNEPLDDFDDGGFPMDDDDERYEPSDNPRKIIDLLISVSLCSLTTIVD